MAHGKSYKLQLCVNKLRIDFYERVFVGVICTI